MKGKQNFSKFLSMPFNIKKKLFFLGQLMYFIELHQASKYY